MFYSIKIILISFLISFIFYGCNALNFLKKEEIKLEGKRYEILDYKRELIVSEEAALVPVMLGDIEKNSSWNQSGRTASHSPGNLFLDENPELIWKTNVGEGDDDYNKLFAQLVSEEGRIFSLDSEGNIFSLNLHSGKKIWEKKIIPEEESINSNIDGGLAIFNGFLIVSTSYGEIICLDARDGKILWKRKIGKPSQGSPTISENKIFQMTVNNDLIVLDLETGKEYWRYSGSYEPAVLNGASSVAIGDNITIFPSNSGELIAFNKDMGSLIWNTELLMYGGISTSRDLNDIDSGPVIDNNLIFAGTFKGRFGAMDYYTGLVIWDIPLQTTQNPVISGNSVFVITDDAVLISMLRYNGEIRWITDLRSISKRPNHSFWFFNSSLSSNNKLNCKGPILAANKLWLGCEDGTVLTINTEDGKVSNAFRLPGSNALSPIVVDGIIFFYTKDAQIFAYR